VPDAGQQRALARAFGCARVVFNDAVRAREDARKALDSAGCTVIVALLGLVALGLGSLWGIALAVAVMGEVRLP